MGCGSARESGQQILGEEFGNSLTIGRKLIPPELVGHKGFCPILPLDEKYRSKPLQVQSDTGHLSLLV